MSRNQNEGGVEKQTMEIALTLNQYLAFQNYRKIQDEDPLIYVADRLAEVDDALALGLLGSFHLPERDFWENVGVFMELYTDIEGYEPQEVDEGVILGDTYRVPKDLNTMQAVEARQRLMEWNGEEDPEETNTCFSYMCMIGAIVLNSENRTYPEFRSKIVRDAELFFDYLPVDLAYSCVQKASKTWQDLAENPMYKWFFNPPPPREKDAKVLMEIMNRNNEIFNRVGFRSIYNRLVESPAFNAEDKDTYTKNLSIKHSLSVLAQENSMS